MAETPAGRLGEHGSSTEAFGVVEGGRVEPGPLQPDAPKPLTEP